MKWWIVSPKYPPWFIPIEEIQILIHTRSMLAYCESELDEADEASATREGSLKLLINIGNNILWTFYVYLFICAPADSSSLNRQQNKPTCLTVRPCNMHCGWSLKTSVTLQIIRSFDQRNSYPIWVLGLHAKTTC